MEVLRETNQTKAGAVNKNEADKNQSVNKNDVRGAYKILIVEDNPDTLDLTKFILENAGYNVFTAKTAGETLTLLDTVCPESKQCFDYTCLTGKCFDAVLIDYDLPDVTGGTLGGWIRGKFKDIALIIFTGYGRLPAIINSTKKIGASLIEKPVIPETLLYEIERSIIETTKERKLKGEDEKSISTPTMKHILRIANITRRASAL